MHDFHLFNIFDFSQVVYYYFDCQPELLNSSSKSVFFYTANIYVFTGVTRVLATSNERFFFKKNFPNEIRHDRLFVRKGSSHRRSTAAAAAGRL